MLPAPSPLLVLVVFVAVLLLSTLMFAWNVHRSIAQRRWLELKQWARANGLSLRRGEALEVPAPFADLLPGDSRASLVLRDEKRLLVRAGRWNVAAVKLEAEWPETAFRPVAGNQGLVDLLNLRGYPSLPGGERFLTCATTLHFARALAESHARALLPPDLGLVLRGPWLLLDFSSRPFDTLELSRLLSLAEQLRLHLPTPQRV